MMPFFTVITVIVIGFVFVAPYKALGLNILGLVGVSVSVVSVVF